tara:strand:- start:299 stop:469 length:171 start_codon:yes stop_codon:yes gene_type:complete
LFTGILFAQTSFQFGQNYRIVLQENIDQIIDPDAIIIAETIYQFDKGYYNIELIIS